MVIMSQEEHIIPIPIPIEYVDEQEMLNGNGGSELVPQPQLGMSVQGVQEKGQVGVKVKEPANAIKPSVAKFQGPWIFVHAPEYKWRPKVQV